MKRWYRRFEEINNGRQHDRSSDEYEDDVYAFFMNCIHLKDWIRNDQECQFRDKVEAYVNQTPCLETCRQICNSAKHLTLNQGTPSQMKSRIFEFNIGGPKHETISIRYSVEVNGEKIDAFALASEYVQKWQEFLASGKGA